MTMRHEYTDSKSRIAPSILRATVKEAYRLGLGKMHSREEKDRRFVLKDEGERMFEGFFNIFMYKGNPKNYTMTDKLSLGRMLAEEVMARGMVSVIQSAKAFGKIKRAEIKFLVKEKQSLFLDTIENAVQFMDSKGVSITKTEMIAVCIQQVYEMLIEYCRETRVDLFEPATDEEAEEAMEWKEPVHPSEVAGDDYKMLYEKECQERIKAENSVREMKDIARQMLVAFEDVR